MASATLTKRVDAWIAQPAITIRSQQTTMDCANTQMETAKFATETVALQCLMPMAMAPVMLMKLKVALTLQLATSTTMQLRTTAHAISLLTG